MKTILLLLSFICICPFVNGQDKDLHIISSSSKCFKTDNMSLDWTLGEVIVDYFDGASFGLSQGFHQPDYQLVAIKSIPVEFGFISAFPNPFSNELYVKMSFQDFEEGVVELLDLKGVSIWKKSFEGNAIVERFATSTLPSGNYLLVVTLPQESLVQSYQLAKSN